MSKNLKIQTMSDDLDELKGGLQKPSQQVKEEKEKPVAKTVSVGSVVEQVNPKRSMVESVINSMANGGTDKDKQKKNEPKTMKIKEDGKSKNKDVGELQNLVSRISETIPEKEEVLGQEKLPEPNIEPTSKEREEKISREIDKEMEARINKEMEKKVKSEAETVAVASLKIDKNLDINKEGKKNQKNEDAEKLKSLIDRISKTAGKEGVEKSVLEKTGAIPEKKEEKPKEIKEDKTEDPAVLSGKKNNVAGMPLAGKIQKKLPVEFSNADAKDAIDRNGTENQEKKSFWSNISEKLKKGDGREKNSEIRTIPDKKILEDKVEKYNKSGVLTRNDEKVEKTKKDKSFYLKSDKYVLPENRLIHGKQKFYGSVSKRIKSREDKGEIEGLKNVADTKKKQKILSREEEYRKLKKSIISKYHIKLFQLPWKKIIPVALVVILMITLSFWYLMSFVTPQPDPQLSSSAIFGEELSEFANLEKKITISEGSLRGLDSLEKNAKNIFDENRNLKVIKLVIVNTEDEENRNILSLGNSLDALGIISVKDNKNHLPKKFLEMSANKYNFFIFKTRENHIRYGIAVGLKDRYLMSEIMEEWENERSVNKKMITVLKPLFAGDRNYGDIYKSFNSENYNGLEIKYVHLIDEDTALNYFIYNNSKDDGSDLLVITTSRDSAHAIADLLTDN